MKRFPIISLLAAMAAASVSPVAVGAAVEPSTSLVERAVLAQFDRMVSAAEALNADELFRNVAQNDKGAVILNGRMLRTRGEALQTVRENFQRVASIKYQITDRLVTVLSPTAALLVTAGTVNSATPDGRTLSRPFIHSIVFVLQDGDWRVVHSHQSSPPLA